MNERPPCRGVACHIAIAHVPIAALLAGRSPFDPAATGVPLLSGVGATLRCDPRWHAHGHESGVHRRCATECDISSREIVATNPCSRAPLWRIGASSRAASKTGEFALRGRGPIAQCATGRIVSSRSSPLRSSSPYSADVSGASMPTQAAFHSRVADAISRPRPASPTANASPIHLSVLRRAIRARRPQDMIELT